MLYTCMIPNQDADVFYASVQDLFAMPSESQYSCPASLTTNTACQGLHTWGLAFLCSEWTHVTLQRALC